MPDYNVFALTATDAHAAVARNLAGDFPGPNRVAIASIMATHWLRVIAARDGVTLLCERCGRPFRTDAIRPLCGVCQRAQEAA